ncbi:hypothetical protein Dimus_001396 [Dionaea muscipula]
MASMVAKSSRNQVCPTISIQEKGNPNKRKFCADHPVNNDPNKGLSSHQTECPTYESSAEKFEIDWNHGTGASDTCGVDTVGQGHSETLELDLGLSTGLAPFYTKTFGNKGEIEVDGFHDADWSEFTETQLEELVLCNLDAISKSAIKKIVACGYSEEVATNAVLRSGSCCCWKDTVPNIVDTTLAYLRNGQHVDPSWEHYFKDLQQLEKYVLEELVCVLRKVRPFCSTGDAMWCLLIWDMNVSQACAMDDDPLGSFLSDGTANGSSSAFFNPEAKTESITTEMNLPNPCNRNQSNPCNNGSQLEMDKVAGIARMPQVPALEEKFVSSRKIHSNSSKREPILQQKSIHLEKSYGTYGSKGASRTGKLSGLCGLFFDKKMKSLSDSTSVHFKHCSIKISKATGVDVAHELGSLKLPANSLLSSSASSFPAASSSSFSLDSVHASPKLPKPDNSPLTPVPSVLPPSDVKLSLSLTTKSNTSLMPVM